MGNLAVKVGYPLTTGSGLPFAILHAHGHLLKNDVNCNVRHGRAIVRNLYVRGFPKECKRVVPLSFCLPDDYWLSLRRPASGDLQTNRARSRVSKLASDVQRWPRPRVSVLIWHADTYPNIIRH